ncbi:MAG: glycosyltransferase, partial [Roseiflexaceae bacterium]
MSIVVDARLNAYRNGGIPQYTRQLIHAMAAEAPTTAFTVLQHRRQPERLIAAANVTRQVIYTPPHHRWEPWVLPIEIGVIRPQVVLFPDFIAPVWRSFPAVVTIHDLAFLHFDDLLDDHAKAFYAPVGPCAKRADGIFALSESTKNDIVTFLDIAPERIT